MRHKPYTVIRINKCLIEYRFKDINVLKKLYIASYICIIHKPDKAYLVIINDKEKSKKHAKKVKSLKLCLETLNNNHEYYVDNTPVQLKQLADNFYDHAVIKIDENACIVLLREHK